MHLVMAGFGFDPAMMFARAAQRRHDVPATVIHLVRDKLAACVLKS